MAALAAELQFSHLGQAQIPTTSYCSSASGNDKIFSRVAFTSRFCGNRSRFEAIRLVSSSSTGRWLPLTQCGEWRVSSERNLGGELGQQWFSGKVGTTRRSVAVHVSSVVGGLEASKPTYVPLEPITGEASFDQVLSEAAERNQPVVIDWLANWCRKCIYLKPKLEKLAAEYYPDIKFYFVDVNAVPQAVVKRAEVTKMPTVQIWKDGKKLAEVIGGNKTWMVMDEVREMIKNKK